MPRKSFFLPRHGTFERRVWLALLLFSAVPSLVLLGLGTYVAYQGFSVSGVTVSWERVAASGRVLLDEAERSGDPALVQAAQRHRAELTESLVQGRRWSYLLQRAVGVLLIGAAVLALAIILLALRTSRRMARRLSRPIRALVGWAETIARGEPLPPQEPAGTTEFRVLSDAFRRMSGELVASRERALEAERMRAWVSLARGVAHELKNPLTPLRLAVRTLQLRLSRSDGLACEALEVIAAESERLEELARSFSEFGRLPEGQPSEVDLRELMDYLLRTHLPAGVGRLRAPVQLPLVRGHHDALQRAFANLLLNAGEAMDGGAGQVTVTLAVVGEAVEVRITDTGPGIPTEHLATIWEPGFTTKARGTGLGLALVRQTLQAHGGTVAARNRPEGGAEFRVRLPIQGYPLSVNGYPSGVQGAAEPANETESAGRPAPGENPAPSPRPITDNR